MKKRIKVLSVMAMFGTLLGVAACGEVPSATSVETPSTSETTSYEVKDKYTVTFDFNYEGGGTKSMLVNNGKTTKSYAARRTGYDLEGWYTDKECTDGNKFDFAKTPITHDITLYAKWKKQAEKFEVTFNFNYEGADEPATVSVTEGTTIKESQIPECPRLGFEFEGWYTDKACKNEFDMSTEITGATTLYAKYQYDNSIPRNNDGSIKFNNVTVKVWCWTSNGGWGYTGTNLNHVVSKFNDQYKGKITVELNNGGTLTQDDYSVRIQQTPGVNATIDTYYTAGDVLDFAGVSFNKNDWYGNAIKENYVKGKLKTVPLAANVPFIAYNKELMNKYSNGNLPSNYTEFLDVLKRAYDGEHPTNNNFVSITSGGSWTFKEATSQTAFLQNDAPYYVYKNGSYVNEWGTDATGAKTAVNNFYELFGAGGKAHGEINPSLNDFESDIINKVVEKNALMKIINLPSASATNIQNITNVDDKIGFMPISGLFADSDKTNANAVSYHQINVAFYKAKNVDMTQLAAGGVFANFLADNLVDLDRDYSLARCGWYPLKKTVAAKALTDTGNAKAQRMLKAAGDPNNFTTLDGHVSEKPIINQTVAETYLVEIPTWTNSTAIENFVASIKSAISSNL